MFSRLFQTFFLLRQTQYLCNLCGSPQCLDVKIRVDKGDRKKDFLCGVPVAEAPAAGLPIGDKAVFVSAFQVLKPVKHGAKAILQDVDVPIVDVILVGYLDNCGAPGRRSAASSLEWGGVLYPSARLILAVQDVTNPFAVQSLSIQRKHYGAAPQLAVAGVA